MVSLEVIASLGCVGGSWLAGAPTCRFSHLPESHWCAACHAAGRLA